MKLNKTDSGNAQESFEKENVPLKNKRNEML